MSAITKAERNLPLPFARGSATSEAAALKARPGSVAKRTAILGYLIGRDTVGATNDEVCAALGFGTGTVCPRMKELREAGDLVSANCKRKTRTGTPAEVWIHKDAKQCRRP